MKTADLSASEVTPWSKSQADGEDVTSPGDTTTRTSLGLSFENGMSTSWNQLPNIAHVLRVEQVCERLDVNTSNGLTTSDAEHRLQKYGPNKLQGKDRTSPWRILIRQVSNSLTLVLVLAMALSYGIMDYIEGSVITAVIFLNIIIGFFQDYRAEETMQSLKALSAPICKVIRNNGHIETIKTENLVVGDIVSLATGDIIPADLRLFHGFNLETNEALLTGESLPIPKIPLVNLDKIDIPLGDRTNMAYSASTITKGRGAGIVVATAGATEVGRIAKLLNETSAPSKSATKLSRIFSKTVDAVKAVLGLAGTPLQVKLSYFALLLFGLAIILAIIVFSANKWDVSGEVLLYGVCVAVAVIPESLIAVLTITMAVGTNAMAKGHVVVRKLQAIEAVGGVTNVCSDKTGTLTQGKMIVRTAWIPKLGTLSVHGTQNILDPRSGVVKLDEMDIDTEVYEKSSPLTNFLNAIALCNLASVYEPIVHNTVEKQAANTGWSAVGDPTEIALQVFAMRFSHGASVILETGNIVLTAEHPFDSSMKRMSVVYHNTATSTIWIYAKGAVEAILPIMDISDTKKSELSALAEAMAVKGLRVLCVASKTMPQDSETDLSDRAVAESQLDFLGLVGLYDPPRLGTLDSVKSCHQAGITVHMLTGDHLSTASAIACEVGIVPPTETPSPNSTVIMAAATFDSLSDTEIDALPALPLVIARCSPMTKVNMVNALHRRKAFCIMTGDGVNDSPALKRADVGIAMGLNGSDVAKDCADMVLTDDDFSSIIRAIKEGRRLFDNIQKFLLHLLISNIAQVILLLIGLAFRDDENHSVFPLSPLEILWVNMITSSFLALGLGMEAASPDLMLRPPQDLRIGVFTKSLIIDKMVYGTAMGILCLVAFICVVFGYGDGQLGNDCNEGYNDTCYTVYRARATVFAVLSCLLLVTAWEVKHFSRSLFAMSPARTGPFSIFSTIRENRFLFWAVIGGFLGTFPVVYIPIVNKVVFKHLGIGWEWGVVVACVVVYLGVLESWKAGKRRLSRSTSKIDGSVV